MCTAKQHLCIEVTLRASAAILVAATRSFECSHLARRLDDALARCRPSDLDFYIVVPVRMRANILEACIVLSLQPSSQMNLYACW
jgi:hypothetical protein